MKRCFVAFGIAPETSQALQNAQTALLRLRCAPSTKLRAVKAANLHLTLKFLGAIEDDVVPRVTAALENIATRTPSVPVSLRGLETFGGPRPRAIFAQVATGSDYIVELTQRIDHAVVPLGLAAETKPRVPHVTLFRVEAKKRDPGLLSYLSHHPNEPLYGAVDTSAIILYESQLREAGSYYHELGRFSLLPSAAK